jgi:hypothetical protein
MVVPVDAGIHFERVKVIRSDIDLNRLRNVEMFKMSQFFFFFFFFLNG